MNEQEIERCLERFTMGKATDVMNFDYAGTLAYIQRLKAENAALRKRLENALVLPAKVGDTIFEVGGQYTKNIVPWKIREIILYSNGVRFICDCEDGGDLHRCVDVYNNEMQTFWDKSPFCLTYASAEKRLKELGGEK